MPHNIEWYGRGATKPLEPLRYGGRYRLESAQNGFEIYAPGVTLATVRLSEDEEPNVELQIHMGDRQGHVEFDTFNGAWVWFQEHVGDFFLDVNAGGPFAPATGTLDEVKRTVEELDRKLFAVRAVKGFGGGGSGTPNPVAINTSGPAPKKPVRFAINRTYAGYPDSITLLVGGEHRRITSVWGAGLDNFIEFCRSPDFAKTHPDAKQPTEGQLKALSDEINYLIKQADKAHKLPETTIMPTETRTAPASEPTPTAGPLRETAGVLLDSVKDYAAIKIVTAIEETVVKRLTQTLQQRGMYPTDPVARELTDRGILLSVPLGVHYMCCAYPERVPQVDKVKRVAEYAIRGNVLKNMDLFVEIVMPIFFEFAKVDKLISDGIGSFDTPEISKDVAKTSNTATA